MRLFMASPEIIVECSWEVVIIWLHLQNSTKAGVDKALKGLLKKNLLEKKEYINRGIKYCIYVAKEVANLVSYQSTELGGVANSVSRVAN